MVSKYNITELNKLRHDDLFNIALLESLVKSGQKVSKQQLVKLISSIKVEVNPPFENIIEADSKEDDLSVNTVQSSSEVNEVPTSSEVNEVPTSSKPTSVSLKEKSNSRLKSLIDKAIRDRSASSDVATNFEQELAKRQGKTVTKLSFDDVLRVRKNKYKI